MLLDCYKILSKIYKDGSFSGIALNAFLDETTGESNKIITKIVYGVLDKDILLEYYISKLCKKRPDNDTKLILKIGLFQILFLSIPDYAAVNNTVELIKQTPKRQLSGFINAVLKNYKSVVLPKGNDPKSLSVRFSYPVWLVERIVRDYKESYLDILSFQDTETLKTHIRHNQRLIDKKAFLAKLDGYNYTPSVLGYYVDSDALKHLSKQKQTCKMSFFTVQSLASMLITASLNDQVQAILNNSQKPTSYSPSILDTCAAPGGKSVFISELLPNSQITACDIKPHRVSLIQKYAKSMGANNITAIQCDSSCLRNEFVGKFDAVLCDVPCSGTGAIASKPDIMLNRKSEDIAVMAETQFNIVSVCSNYVRAGGRLVYSTCSILKEENESVIERFLVNNPNFHEVDFEFRATRSLKMSYGRQLLPHISNCEGFFTAILERV